MFAVNGVPKEGIMPKSASIIIKTGIAIAVFVLALIAVGYVCNLVSMETSISLGIKILVILAILTGASLAIAYLSGDRGRSQDSKE
jgi:hypothetical protein